MRIDSRGGHNRKQININFFKNWSSSMAYVLGYICADGSIIDSQKSSRTCYIKIVSKDMDILEKIKSTLKSNHTITLKPEKKIRIRGKSYLQSGVYEYKFGSKEIFQDIINLGITPKKALRMELPRIPTSYISHFVRGYFDGDGCVFFGKEKMRSKPRLRVIFTSGSKIFLDQLNSCLNACTSTSKRRVFRNKHAYRLVYEKRDSLRLLPFMYKEVNNNLYLERKYKIYQMVQSTYGQS